MKYIPVPAAVEIIDIEGNPLKFAGETEKLTFEKFVLARLTDPQFAGSMANVMAAVSIRDAVKSASAGFVEIENEHYELLSQIVKNPSPAAGYPPGLAHNLVPFMRAIVNEALDKKPG